MQILSNFHVSVLIHSDFVVQVQTMILVPEARRPATVIRLFMKQFFENFMFVPVSICFLT